MLWTSRMASPPHNLMQNSDNNEETGMMSSSGPKTSPMSSNQMTPHKTPKQASMQQTPVWYSPASNHHQINAHAASKPTTPTQQRQEKLIKMGILMHCRLGQEIIRRIVNNTHLFIKNFSLFRDLNLTNKEVEAKIVGDLRIMKDLFENLRLIYKTCNEYCQLQDMENIQIESLIPYKDEINPKHGENENSEACRLARVERNKLKKQVVMRNKQLKEIIDHLRRTIWEITTMTMMSSTV